MEARGRVSAKHEGPRLGHHECSATRGLVTQRDTPKRPRKQAVWWHLSPTSSPGDAFTQVWRWTPAASGWRRQAPAISHSPEWENRAASFREAAAKGASGSSCNGFRQAVQGMGVRRCSAWRSNSLVDPGIPVRAGTGCSINQVAGFTLPVGGTTSRLASLLAIWLPRCRRTR